MRGLKIKGDFEVKDLIPVEVKKELDYFEAKLGLKELSELMERGKDD